MLFLQDGHISDAARGGKTKTLKVTGTTSENEPSGTRPSGESTAEHAAGTAAAPFSAPVSTVESTASADSPITIHLPPENGFASSHEALAYNIIKAHVRSGILPILYDHAAALITRAFAVLPNDHRVTVKVPGHIRRRRDDA